MALASLIFLCLESSTIIFVLYLRLLSVCYCVNLLVLIVVEIMVLIQYTNTDSIVIDTHLLADDACGTGWICGFAAEAAAAAAAISLFLRDKREL